MKKAEIRTMDEPSLLEGVGQLRIETHPHVPLVYDREFYYSVYRWLKTHPLGDQAYHWVAVADGRVVGNLTATPQYYRIHGERVVAHTPGDYMVDPKYGFQAIALMRKYFRATGNYVSCDMVPAVIEIETRFGAEVAGPLQYAAKLLNVSRLPVPPVPAPVRRLLNLPDPNAPARGYTNQPGVENEEEYVAPPPVRPRMPLPAPVKSLLNGGLQTVDEVLGAVFGGPLKVEVIEEFDESFNELFEAVAGAVPCTPERDAAFLRWRYGPGSPQEQITTVLGIKSGETLLGYAVLLVTHARQDGYILDFTTLPEHRDAARALLRAAIRFFRRSGVQIIRYRHVQSPTSASRGDLQRLGFFFRKGRNNILLARFQDRGGHKAATDVANWSYTVGDGEASFYVR